MIGYYVSQDRCECSTLESFRVLFPDRLGQCIAHILPSLIVMLSTGHLLLESIFDMERMPYVFFDLRYVARGIYSNLDASSTLIVVSASWAALYVD